MKSLDDRLLLLQGDFSPETLRILRDFLAGATDAELFRINPLRFAEEHGMSEGEAIELFIHATHAGIFEFSWDILCPGCGSALKGARALRELEDQARCAACEIDVDVQLDDSIEVSFTVSPTVRGIRFHHPETLDTVEEWLQLATSASRILHPEFARLQREHTLCSSLLHAGEETELPLSLSEGSYRLISLTHHRSARLDIEQGAEPTPEIRGEFGERGVVLSQATAHPGNLRLRLRNHGAEAVLFTVIKRPPMTLDCLPSELRTRFRPFLDGKRLLTTQAFRELFRAETIAPGGSFSLRTLTILFTDLKGSTALYERVGDLAAYRLVREHFKILEEAVAAGGGAIVKTIGDAIMATFPHPRQAVGTISRMHHRLDEWNRANGEEDLTLKVGLHEGPCIAVNSNDKVDFFGQTVNLAARIQGLAGSRETYLSESVLAREGVQETLGREGFELHPETAHLKGISEEVRVVRATLPIA